VALQVAEQMADYLLTGCDNALNMHRDGRKKPSSWGHGSSWRAHPWQPCHRPDDGVADQGDQHPLDGVVSEMKDLCGFEFEGCCARDHEAGEAQM